MAQIHDARLARLAGTEGLEHVMQNGKSRYFRVNVITRTSRIAGFAGSSGAIGVTP